MNWDQVLGLYNYWVVIFLMMTGFYIVIARGNLIKTIIGLNIFQTSVFLLYITMGKVNGGTAPILRPGDKEFVDGHEHHGHEDGSHGEHGHEAHGHEAHGSGHHEPTGEYLEDPSASVEHASGVELSGSAIESNETIVQLASHVVDETVATGHAVAEVSMMEVPFTNPLPSVLMLTAIVVGIATTALALALVVRIQEDYGTIEEDEILEMDKQS